MDDYVGKWEDPKLHFFKEILCIHKFYVDVSWYHFFHSVLVSVGTIFQRLLSSNFLDIVKTLLNFPPLPLCFATSLPTETSPYLSWEEVWKPRKLQVPITSASATQEKSSPSKKREEEEEEEEEEGKEKEIEKERQHLGNKSCVNIFCQAPPEL